MTNDEMQVEEMFSAGVNTWDEAIDCLSDAVDRVNNVVANDLEISSFVNELSSVSFRINPPVVWAKFLMENLDYPMSGPDALSEEEKLFWAKVAFEMGPDWINKFRRIGAWMAAAEKA